MKTNSDQAGAAVMAVLRQVRRLIVLIIGTTLLLVGVVMLVTPGPAVVVIPLGLGVLALEFAWARRLLRRFRERLEEATHGTISGGRPKEEPLLAEEEVLTMTEPRMLSHTVLFCLRDKSPRAQQSFLSACREQLRGHEGEVFFAAGEMADDIAWDISDRDFDVILQIVFCDKAAHDVYQESPRHVRFLEDHQDAWTAVRAIDAYVG